MKIFPSLSAILSHTINQQFALILVTFYWQFCHLLDGEITLMLQDGEEFNDDKYEVYDLFCISSEGDLLEIDENLLKLENKLHDDR